MEDFNQIISFFAQLPILAIFIWWVAKSNSRWDKNNDQWRDYLRERNGKLERSLSQMNEISTERNIRLEKAVDNLSGAIYKLHDRLDK